MVCPGAAAGGATSNRRGTGGAARDLLTVVSLGGTHSAWSFVAARARLSSSLRWSRLAQVGPGRRVSFLGFRHSESMLRFITARADKTPIDS